MAPGCYGNRMAHTDDATIRIGLLLCFAASACGDGTKPVPPPESPCPGTPFNAWTNDPQLCVYEFASGLGAPRQMAFAP